MYKKCFKILLDFIFALICLPFFLVLLMFLVPVIYLDDKGPIFYSNQRIGKNGVLFKMYKFRSMKVNAPDIRNEDGTTFSSADDPRLTKVGKILRETSIDELPQIINVIKGDMSFIGPRPDLPEAIHMYNELEKVRMLVRPGISGYTQAYYRNTLPLNERIGKDVYYAENLSYWLDVKIFFVTIKCVLVKDNVYRDNNTIVSEEDIKTGASIN